MAISAGWRGHSKFDNGHQKEYNYIVISKGGIYEN